MNMSYCRFQNTLTDLRDCFDNWEDTPDDELSDDETRARKRLLKLCQEIAECYGDGAAAVYVPDLAENDE